MPGIVVWTRLAFATAAVTLGSSAAHASTGTDTVIWTSSDAPSLDSCHDEPSYTRPGRYSLRYACGRWYLHKPVNNVYTNVMLVGLLGVGLYLRFGRTKQR